MMIGHLRPTCRWLGVLMLLLRVLGPAQPMPDVAGAGLAAFFPGGLPICHATEPGQTDPVKPPVHDCQLCLACHVAAQAPLLPVEAVRLPPRHPSIRLDHIAWVSLTAPPPALRRRATPPIGPPAPPV